MLFSKINVGDRVEVVGTYYGDKVIFTSLVRSLASDQKVFTINTPRTARDDVFVPESGTFSVSIFTKKMALSCGCLVIRNNVDDDIMSLRVITPVTEIQRRSSVRYNCNLPLKYFHITDGADFFTAGGTQHKGIVENISKGGALMTGDIALPKHAELKMIIESQPTPLVVDARVIRQKHIDEAVPAGTGNSKTADQKNAKHKPAPPKPAAKYETCVQFVAVIREEEYLRKVLVSAKNTTGNNSNR